jgi:hypothetical protein
MAKKKPKAKEPKAKGKTRTVKARVTTQDIIAVLVGGVVAGVAATYISDPKNASIPTVIKDNAPYVIAAGGALMALKLKQPSARYGGLGVAAGGALTAYARYQSDTQTAHTGLTAEQQALATAAAGSGTAGLGLLGYYDPAIHARDAVALGALYVTSENSASLSGLGRSDDHGGDYIDGLISAI